MRVCKHGCDVLDSRVFSVKAIEHFFRVYKASSKHSEGWENSRKQTFDYVSGLHNCLEFSQPSSCLDEAIYKHGKSALLLKQKPGDRL